MSGALGVCALVLALLLSGCGGDEGASTTSSSSTAGGAGKGESAPSGEKSIEGFGSEAAGADKEAILGTFEAYLGAIAAEDPAAACSHLAANVQQSLEQLVAKELKGAGCAAILPKLLSPTAPAISRAQAEGQITKVRVEGDRAFVVFHAPGAKLYQLTMVREDGEWKAATVTPAVLVPDLSGVTP